MIFPLHMHSGCISQKYISYKYKVIEMLFAYDESLIQSKSVVCPTRSSATLDVVQFMNLMNKNKINCPRAKLESN